jgi:hypothetical protein
MDRKNLSKRRRFEVFKRDRFACQYCGRTPPTVVLQVDHIVAVAEGGSDDPQNLLTACFDCNQGKGAVPLSDRLSEEELRIEQAEAYEALLQERRRAENAAIEEVVEIFEEAFEGWTIPDHYRPPIREFLRLLPRSEVFEAMELACSRVPSDRALKYFCGICWNKAEDRR